MPYQRNSRNYSQGLTSIQKTRSNVGMKTTNGGQWTPFLRVNEEQEKNQIKGLSQTLSQYYGQNQTKKIPKTQNKSSLNTTRIHNLNQPGKQNYKHLKQFA